MLFLYVFVHLQQYTRVLKNKSMKLDECKLWFKNEYIDMIGRNYQEKFKFGTKISVIWAK
jgi:hypothetical protein